MEKEATNDQNAGGDDLDSHRDAPCCRRCRIQVLIDAIIDPETDQGAGLIGNLEETGQDTAD